MGNARSQWVLLVGTSQRVCFFLSKSSLSVTFLTQTIVKHWQYTKPSWRQNHPTVNTMTTHNHITTTSHGEQPQLSRYTHLDWLKGRWATAAPIPGRVWFGLELFYVTVRSGATFKQLADLAKNSKDKFAFQIVAGGICSLTIKSGKFISYERDTTKITTLKGNILDILSVLGPRVTVATVPPANIAKYNRFKKHPDSDNRDWQIRQQEQQQLLNDDLSDLNSFIEEKNATFGSTQVYLVKASCANSVKRRGKYRTKRAIHRGYTFTRMYDGVHADSTLKGLWCKKIVSASRQAILSQSVETSQESAQEEDWGDFKRRRN